MAPATPDGTVTAMAEPRRFPQLRFTAPPGAADILLIRHGQSQPAVEDQLFPLRDGHGDPPLSELGRRQAERLGRRLSRAPIAAIYVSTLQRTAQTAAPMAEALGLRPTVEPDLREVFLGEWEGGQYRQKMAEGDPVGVRAIAEERWDVIPGAEPSEAFARRVRGALTRIAAAHPDQVVACVAHGGVIGQALAMATGSRPFAFLGVDNAAISRLVVTADQWVLRSFNDTSHLDELEEPAPVDPAHT